MMNLVPIKKLGKHRKAIVTVVVILLVYKFQIFLFQSTPVAEKTNVAQVQIDRTLPENIIPNLRKLLKKDEHLASTQSVPRCDADAKTAKHNTTLGYTPNITRTNFSTTEQILFEELRKSVRDATEAANELLRSAMLSEAMGEIPPVNDPYRSLGKERGANREDRARKESSLSVNFGSYMYFPGGHWIPRTCDPKWKVAIIIPYRDRFENLNTLLRNLVPFLLNQKLEFGMFIAEQGSSEMMNRGLMRNIGYQLALHSGTDWDCFVFHDVDYVPMNATNNYGCDDFPKHYAINLEEFNYSNPYVSDFGGVVGLTREQVTKINGYSNMFWGWGGEDDDVLYRIRVNKYNVSRSKLGFYRNLHHEKKTKNETCRERFCLLKFARRRMRTDGLSAIRYMSGANFSLSTLYTNMSVDVRKEMWNFFPVCSRYTKQETSTVAVVAAMCYAGVIILLFSCIILASVRSSDSHSLLSNSEDEEDDEEEVHGRRLACIKYGELRDEDSLRLLDAHLSRYR